MAVNSNSGSDILTHPDISVCIVKRITNLSDYIRFGSVCKAWRSTALLDRFATNRHQPPGLISTARSLWNSARYRPISHGAAVYNRLRLRWLNERSSIRALNPNCGWLVSTNSDRFLVNPVTGSRVPLPGSGKQGTYSIAKASMTTTPRGSGSGRFVLVLHYGPVMSICELGDSDWRYVESGSEAVVFRDAIFFDRRFFALTSDFGVFAIDEDQFGADSPVTRLVARLDLEELDPERGDGDGDGDGECGLRLVEIGGDLMVLVHYPERKRRFEMYKLDLSTKGWIRVEESFGDYALFVGDGQAFALSMSNVPDATDSYKCIVANHVYFAAAKAGESFVYNFADCGVRGLCCPQHLTNTRKQAALWFTPVPW